MRYIELVFSSFVEQNPQFQVAWVEFHNGTVFHTDVPVEDRDTLVAMAKDYLSVDCTVIPGTSSADFNVSEAADTFDEKGKNRFCVTYGSSPNVMSLPEYDVSQSVSKMEVGLSCRTALGEDVMMLVIKSTSMD